MMEDDTSEGIPNHINDGDSFIRTWPALTNFMEEEWEGDTDVDMIITIEG